MNVINADFTQKYKDTIFQLVKQSGFKRTEKLLIESGEHKFFVKAILKRIMRTNAW